MLFVFIGSTYFINECQAQKPEITYLSRFLFRLGRAFIQKPACPPAAAPSAALEEPDSVEEEIKEGLALFEPSPPTLATQPTTTQAAPTVAQTQPSEKQEDVTEEATEEAAETTEAPEA